MQSYNPSVLNRRESNSSIYTFEVDSANRISAVSDNWDAFALQNGGEEACAGRVLGRPWWEFVVGEEVRMLYAGLLQKVRLNKRHLTVPFRCDGPTVRRFMTMSILPGQDNAVVFRCELLREEPTDPVPLLSRETRRNASMIHLCGWCGRAEIGNSWIEVDAAIRALKLFEVETIPQISHGICPACEDRFNSLGNED